LTIKRLSFITLWVTYILIVFGGYVASSQSGMGCGPDWPLCNGVLVPVLQGETLVEYTHRMIGAFLVLLSMILFIKILRANVESTIRSAAYWMLGILVVQVIFGAIVVILDLPAEIVTLHLLLAMAFMASLIWIWRVSPSYGQSDRNYLGKYSRDFKQSTMFSHFNVILILILLVLGVGAYIKHQHYGLACGWLNCNEAWLPVTYSQFLQTSHRALAAVFAIYILYVTYLSFYKNWGFSVQRRLILVSMIVIIQVVVGVIVILTNISISWAVLHLAIGTLLFAVVIESWVFLRFRK
jgi:cytochrome c oxidase assembly protein subunit 15